MTKMSCPKFILGYSDEDTVKLDFDQMSFSKVKYWASKALRHFKLVGLRVAYRFSNQSENIREFLKNRRLIVKITTKYAEKT